MTDQPPTNHPTDRGDQPPADQEDDHDLAAAVRRAGWFRTSFYVVVLLVALVGQVTGAVEALGMHWLVAIPAVGALELGGMVVLNNADVRRRLGERAVGSRILSVGIAGFAVVFNWLGHTNHLLGAFYSGMSLLGYLVWVMSTENKRRDRLRAKGQLPPTAPAYPASQWLRHPWLTARARRLALASPDLGLYGSLVAAAMAVRAERRQAAIATILRRQIRASADPTSAEIAVTVFDLDEIAARLVARANYDGLTDIVAVGLDPDRLLRPAVGATNPTMVVEGEVVESVDQPARESTNQTGATDRTETTNHDGSPDHPTARRRATAQPAIRSASTDRPTGRPHLSVVGRPAAVANAAILREIYRDGLPTVERQIRNRTGWSKERVEKAVEAYQAGADLEPGNDDEQGDEPAPTTSTA